jgi:hypothetical protein
LINLFIPKETIMKKIAGLFFIAAAISFTTQSCKKDDNGPTVTHTVAVSLRANESYSYQVPKAGDADDVMQITKQAGHSLISKVSPVVNSENTLFEYTPALGFTGSDEVQVTNVENHSGQQGAPHHGNCSGGKGHHEGTTTYIFKINVIAAN